MNTSQRVFAALLLLVGGLVFANATPASARGGAASIMTSPGYQRALEESRRRYRQEAQPAARPQPVHPRKKKRHRGHH